MSKNSEEILLNENINFKEVRCLGDNGQQYGIMSANEALHMAQSEGLDLVLLAPNANPPVCKIMDYNKFRYQQEKKQKEAKKKQKQIEIKEIKLSVKIASNDIAYKVKHAREFLEENKHVRFRVFLKGREVSSPQVGIEVLERVWALVEDVAVIEKEAKVEGRYVNMTVIPKPKK